MKTSGRESNYDFLRLISTIAVIMIHVSATYKGAITGDSTFGYFYKDHMVTILVYNTLSRFAVPCFMMLTGAFVLADNRNSEYKFFYRKSIKSIGIPTFIFTILYLLFSEGIKVARIVFKGEPISELLSPIQELIIGAPYYHMWYLYTLLGVYLLIPFVIEFKNKIGENKFEKISYFILPITVISGWTSNFTLNWSIAKVVCYLGFLLMGYQIRRKYVDVVNNNKGIFFILLGILIECVLTCIQYEHSLRGLAEIDEKFSIVESFNPLVVLASVFIFIGFSQINVSILFKNISVWSLYVYLFHAGVWDILIRVIKKIDIKNDARIIIPISILIVFIISYFLSIIYMKLWKRIEDKYFVSEKVCNILRLS